MLQDIAILTGGQVISEEPRIELENVTLADLGTAEMTIDKDNTTIVNEVEQKSKSTRTLVRLRRTVETTTSDYDKEKLQSASPNSQVVSPYLRRCSHGGGDEREEGSGG